MKFVNYFILGALVVSGSSHSAFAVGNDLTKTSAATLIQRKYRDYKARQAYQARKAQKAQALANRWANDDDSDLLYLPNEILMQIANNLGQHDLNSLACASARLNQVANDPGVRPLEPWKGFTEFDQQFVPIPEGKLSDGTQIASFEAGKYPVTQKIWGDIMGWLPRGVQKNCPNCPITHVAWENGFQLAYSRAEVQIFLDKLNELTKSTGCTYDLPTDKQNEYQIRADATGTSTAKYSMAKDPQTGALFNVDNSNVNRFVTHWGNSGDQNGSNQRIQPVGSKEPNAFGIELGNVWRMSKDQYYPNIPVWGRSVRGGSWLCDVALAARSVSRFCASAGGRSGDMGFSLVRTCH